MNTCEKCGLPFYGEADQKVCGDCRAKRPVAAPAVKRAKGKADGWSRRILRRNG